MNHQDQPQPAPEQTAPDFSISPEEYLEALATVGAPVEQISQHPVGNEKAIDQPVSQSASKPATIRNRIMPSPIIFSEQIIKAIFAGEATQTRRVVKQGARLDEMLAEMFPEGHLSVTPRSPYGAPGNILWVREAYRFVAWDDDFGTACITYRDGQEKTICPGEVWGENAEFVYESLYNECMKIGARQGEAMQNGVALLPEDTEPRWRTPIFMPRALSRINLKVTDVRLEMLQNISADDCISEGIRSFEVSSAALESSGDPVLAFSLLWDSINGKKHPWSSNPWVWAIDFQLLA